MMLPDPSAFIAAGASAEVFRMDGGRVLKLFHAGIDPSIVAREVTVGRLVERTGLPVPRLMGVEQVGERQGIVYAEVRGPDLLAHIARNPLRARRALGQMAQLQARIAQCRLPGLRSRKAVLAEDIGAGPVSERLRAAAIGRLDLLREDDALTHGDLHPGNIIVTGEGVTLIDWSRAACGTAGSDLARTEMLMRFGPGRGGGDVGAAEAAMRDAAAAWYVERYRRLTGLDVEALEAWRPLVALAWLRQRAPVREAAFAAYLEQALARAGLPPLA